MSDLPAAIGTRATKFTIGRDKDCDVAIIDDSVSRIHAELRFLDGGKLLLADIGSANGTSVIQGGRPRPIQQSYVLPSDQVQFGSVVLSVGDLIAVIHAKASKPAIPSAGEPLPVEGSTPARKGAWAWIQAHQKMLDGRWRQALLVMLILLAAVLLWVDSQSPSFKFLVGILGSLIASLMFTVLQRFWEHK